MQKRLKMQLAMLAIVGALTDAASADPLGRLGPNFLLVDDSCQMLGSRPDWTAPDPQPGTKSASACSRAGQKVTCVNQGQDSDDRFQGKRSTVTKFRVLSEDEAVVGLMTSGTIPIIVMISKTAMRFTWVSTQVLESGATVSKHCIGRVAFGPTDGD